MVLGGLTWSVFYHSRRKQTKVVATGMPSMLVWGPFNDVAALRSVMLL